MHVAIVGNAPSSEDLSAIIDASAFVVRFNAAFGFGDVRGRRVDDVWLINCGGQMEEWLQTRALPEMAHVNAAGRTVLPVAPEVARFYAPPLTADEKAEAAAQDWTDAARSELANMGKRVHVVPPDVYRAASAALGKPVFRRGMPMPSTGFVALYAYHACLPTHARIAIAGFTFEGWSGHDWAAERDWVERLVGLGRIVRLDRVPERSMPPARSKRRAMALS